MPDEYYEPDSGIEVNGGGEGVFINFFFKRNVSNVSSFFFVELPDEDYELDSGIEVNGEGRVYLLIFFLKETFLTFLLSFL